MGESWMYVVHLRTVTLHYYCAVLVSERVLQCSFLCDIEEVESGAVVLPSDMFLDWLWMPLWTCM